MEQGIYPAVDPLESTSRILEPDVVGERHYKIARGTQELLQRYRELQDIIAILGGELDKYPEAAFSNVGNVDEVIAKAKKMGAV